MAQSISLMLSLLHIHSLWTLFLAEQPVFVAYGFEQAKQHAHQSWKPLDKEV